MVTLCHDFLLSGCYFLAISLLHSKSIDPPKYANKHSAQHSPVTKRGSLNVEAIDFRKSKAPEELQGDVRLKRRWLTGADV